MQELYWQIPCTSDRHIVYRFPHSIRMAMRRLCVLFQPFGPLDRCVFACHAMHVSGNQSGRRAGCAHREEETTWASLRTKLKCIARRSGPYGRLLESTAVLSDRVVLAGLMPASTARFAALNTPNSLASAKRTGDWRLFASLVCR